MLSDMEVWATIRAWDAALPGITSKAFLFGAGIAINQGQVEKNCQRVGFPAECLLHTQLAAGEKSVSTQQGFELLALANQARGEEGAQNYFLNASGSFDHHREALHGTAFLSQFDAFLKRYGHRGNYETDWALPRYGEDPTPLLHAIRAHVFAPQCPTPEEISIRQEREARETWQEFEEQLNWWQRLTLSPRVRWALQRMKQGYLWRERNRSDSVRVGFEGRRWALVLADRFTERGWIEKRDDYFFLEIDEIDAAMADVRKATVFKALVAQRKGEHDWWQHLEMPLVMRESELPALIRQATSTMSSPPVTQLRGLCVSPGWSEGEVAVLRESTEFAKMKRGAILVAPATDPGWTPLFTLASGVIVEIGGTGSHASTVAREYGLPALANVKHATKLLKDGDYVRLDATNGTVEVLSASINS